MKAKRKRYDSESKSRVALEALNGERTIQQIAKAYDVYSLQVSDWKKRMAQGVSEISETSGKKYPSKDFEQERNNLHRKVAQLSIELDWLQKKSKQLGL